MSDLTPGSRFFFRFIAIILHPVWLPSAMYACLLWICPSVLFGIPLKTQQWWWVIISYITITFPLLVVFLLWRLRFISSMEMKEQKERYGPLMASMMFYFWVFWLFHHQFQAPVFLQRFLLGVFISTVMLFMVSIFYKVSLHTGAWGTVVVFTALLTLQADKAALPLLLGAVLLAGLVGTARIATQAHKPAEVYTGYVCGALAQGIAALILHTSS